MTYQIRENKISELMDDAQYRVDLFIYDNNSVLIDTLYSLEEAEAHSLGQSFVDLQNARAC